MAYPLRTSRDGTPTQWGISIAGASKTGMISAGLAGLFGGRGGRGGGEAMMISEDMLREIMASGGGQFMMGGGGGGRGGQTPAAQQPFPTSVSSINAAPAAPRPTAAVSTPAPVVAVASNTAASSSHFFLRAQ